MGKLDTDKQSKAEHEAEERKREVAFWQQQIEDALEAGEQSCKEGTEAYREYSRRTKDGKADNNDVFPIYWASVRSIQPALYSRTPIPVAEKAFDDLSDEIARVGSLCLERLAKYLMRCTDFDAAQEKKRDNFIHCGKAHNRVCFEGKTDVTIGKIYYTPEPYEAKEGEEVTYKDKDGNEPPEGAELIPDGNQFYAEVENEEWSSVQVDLLPIHHERYFHTPNATTQAEIDFWGFETYLTKAEFREKFGDELMLQPGIKFEPLDNCKDKKKLESKQLYCCVREVWNARKKEVYWLAKGFREDFLKVSEDPYELAGFFPCSDYLLGTVGPDSLYPTPDYVQLKAIIEQMHGAMKRVRISLKSLTRKGITDAAIVDALKAMDRIGDGEFAAVREFNTLVSQKGGLENLVKFFPTAEFANALRELLGAMDVYRDYFNELYGIPDILRGVSDPRETAASQQQKGKYLSLRFSAVQRSFQRSVAQEIQLMCDLALKMFPVEKLMQIMGVQQMPPEEQQLFPQVLPVLQDDQQRKLRINIETDSTITMNEAMEIENRNYLAKILFDGIKAVSDVSEAAPAMAPVVAKTLSYVVRGLRNSEQIEGELDKAVQALLEPQQQAPEQDPAEAAKVQAQSQAQMAKIQLDAQKMQMETQIQQQKLQIAQAEIQLKAQQLQVQAQKLMADAQSDQQKLALQQQIAEIEALTKLKAIEIEEKTSELDIAERVMTERRLQAESEIDQATKVMGVMKDVGNQDA